MRIALLACAAAFAAGAAPAAASPHPVHLGFPDGAAPVNGYVCVGVGCFEAFVVTQAAAPGSVVTAGAGDATIEADPGAVVEAGYTHGYRVDPSFGVYWFRGVAGEGLSFTVPRLLTPGADPGAEPAELGFLALVNQTRVANGLLPLDAEPRLAAAAASHTGWMARSGVQAHVGEHGSTPQSRAEEFGTTVSGGGEIAYLDVGDAAAALAGFMGSEPHRAILLDPAVRHIGIGNQEDSWSALLVGALGPDPTLAAPRPAVLADAAGLGTPAGSPPPPAAPAVPAAAPATVAAPAEPEAARPRPHSQRDSRLGLRLTRITFTRGSAPLPSRRILVFRAAAAATFTARLDGSVLRGTGTRTHRLRIPASAAEGSHTLDVTATTDEGRSTLRYAIRAGRLRIRE